MTNKMISNQHRLKQKRYVFAVDLNLTETEIQREIKQVFKVKVTAVNTDVFKLPVLRKRRFLGKYAFEKEEFQEASVTLAPKYSINLSAYGFINLDLDL